MAPFDDQPGSTLEIRYDPVEVTRDGILTGHRDESRRFVPGPARYFINGIEVSVEEGEAFLEAHGGP